MNFLVEVVLLLPLLFIFYLESFVKLFIPKKRKSVTGEIVLITGAGHGIGRLTAYEFAKLKSKLVLWDINKHGIEETAAECRKLGAQAYSFVVDCSNREDVYNSANKAFWLSITVMEYQDNPLIRRKDLFYFEIINYEEKRNIWLTVLEIPVAHQCGSPLVEQSCSPHGQEAKEKKRKVLRLALSSKAKTETLVNILFLKSASDFRLGPILEPEEVVDKLMNGILTEKRMVLVPSSLNFLLILEKFLPQRFREILKKRINIKFDAVIGYKVKEQ
uniref:Estradiol 17-beta-dehydrogenase 11 n=1 Tax=Urocitellus parryii TaxID=9999 RepID=A0A8D2KDK5_UROPR